MEELSLRRKAELLASAAQGGNEPALRLMAQLVGAPACPHCDYVISACQCPKSPRTKKGESKMQLNYKLIIDELSKGLRDSKELSTEFGWMTRKQYLTEFRTIGFTSVRQTGKTDFLANLVNEGKAIAITYLSSVNNFLNKVDIGYTNRVMAYESIQPEMLEQFKNTGIQYVCLDESRHYSISNDMYTKVLEIFGESVVIIEV